MLPGPGVEWAMLALRCVGIDSDLSRQRAPNPGLVNRSQVLALTSPKPARCHTGPRGPALCKIDDRSRQQCCTRRGQRVHTRKGGGGCCSLSLL